MRNRFLNSICYIIIIASFQITSSFLSPIYSQWKKIHISYDGMSARAVTADGKNIYAASGHGEIFKLNDQADAWENVCKFPEGLNPIKLLLTDTLILAEDSYTIFANNQYSSSMIEFNLPLHGGCIYYRIADLVFFKNCIYAATNPNGIIYSTKDCAPWHSVSDKASGIEYTNFQIFKDNLYLGAKDSGIYVLNSEQTNWLKFKSGKQSINSFAAADSLFFISSDKKIFRSFFSKDEWQDIASLPPGSNFKCLTAFDKMLFIISDSGLYKSENCGASWSSCTKTLKNVVINSYCVKDQIIFLATDNGVYKAKLDELNYSLINKNFAEIEVYSAVETPSKLFAGTKKGLYFSADKGNVWRLETQLPQSILSLARKNNYLYAFPISDPGFYKSFDNGITWQPDTAFLNIKVRNITMDKDNLYVFDGDGIWKSIDWGNTWLPKIRLNISGVSIIEIKDSIIVASADPYVYCSIDFGKSWRSILLRNFSSTICGLAITNSSIYAITGRGEWYEPSGVYISTDCGQNWKHSLFTYSKFICANDTICAVLGEGELFYTKNNGQSWNPITKPPELLSLSFGSNNLYGCSCSGLWSLPFEKITGVEKSPSPLPKEFRLFQNFPNPFNPETTISFEIKTRCTIELVVTDILGRVVSVLLKEEKLPGKYNVRFKAENLSSGVYFYRLNTGSEIISRKMLFLK